LLISQGKQHFAILTSHFHNISSQEERKQKDVSKATLCKQKGKKPLFYYILTISGITLIEVPYWWDRQYDSLAATVYNQRPELFAAPPGTTPIPLTEPSSTSKSPTTESTNNNQLLFIPKGNEKKQFMLATVWDDSQDPTGWLMTEKYDGMRLYWNGTDFITRPGKKMKVPIWISNKLPKIALDGELW
jgi:ATP-dependent DNA ligase